MHPAAALMSHGRAALTQPARASASSAPSGSTRPDAAPAQKAFRLPCPACARGSPRRKGAALRPALLRQRQTDRSSLGNVLQPDAQRKGQRPADGLRLTPQGQRRRKSHHHALGQIVESHGQHHPAHPAMLF